MPINTDFGFTATKRGPFSHRSIEMPSDGDTPIIRQPIRMVSIDTPEKKYGGGAPLQQEKLDAARVRLQSDSFGDLIPQETKDYFVSKLDSDAAVRHTTAANQASTAFEDLLDERLIRLEEPDDDDPTRIWKRNLAVFPSGQMIDTYGRILAYIAPWFSASQLPPVGDPLRNTINLEMLKNGWGALFIIYPSIPKPADFEMALNAARQGFESRDGQWQERELFLPAYEYRALIKLGAFLFAARNARGDIKARYYTEAEKDADEAAQIAAGNTVQAQRNTSPGDLVAKAFQRSVVDIESREALGRFRFDLVPAWRRMWFWTTDQDEALADLGLTLRDDLPL